MNAIGSIRGAVKSPPSPATIKIEGPLDPLATFAIRCNPGGGLNGFASAGASCVAVANIELARVGPSAAVPSFGMCPEPAPIKPDS
jgi:hypothetical protein